MTSKREKLKQVAEEVQGWPDSKKQGVVERPVDTRPATARKRFGNGVPPVYRLGLSLCWGPKAPKHVLDYGCGYARFADEFVATGTHYVATDLVRRDFSDQPGFERAMEEDRADFIPADQLHLCGGYDLVMAANVLNICESEEQLRATIREMFRLVDEGGVVLANYPRSPRRLPLDFRQMDRLIYETLDRKVSMVEDHYSDLVFFLVK